VQKIILTKLASLTTVAEHYSKQINSLGNSETLTDPVLKPS